MSSDILKLAETQSINEIIQLMQKHAIRRTPLVKEDKVIGVVSGDDLLQLLTGELANLAAISKQQSKA